MNAFIPPAFNPMAGNPLRSRQDLVTALRSLTEPLLLHRSTGAARIRLDAASAHFDRAAADLEGFARPLWGLAPLGASGAGDFTDWAEIRRGLANGVDPGHPEFWGKPRDVDQRLVELAAVGFALRMVPHLLWEPLDDGAKANLTRYLLEARPLRFADNNWKFFRVMIDLGLTQAGISFDPAPTRQFQAELDDFHIADGWYRDGPIRRLDHYIPFAMHFYGLLYAKLSDDSERSARYRERARLFAPDFARWFADDGAVLPFGRSMTYRFACGSFWGAAAFADQEVVPWGEAKGYLLRHLRWWSRQPIADRDGVLSIGYGYPNLLMSENYNSAGSPYWAFKTFLPLALPESHPFWQAEELPCPVPTEPAIQRHPGFVLVNSPGNVIALSSGQENREMRFGPEKYAKFAYSSRYGFSIESDERRFADAVFDSMLGFSDDGRHFRVRESNAEARIAGSALYARWHPYPDVTVETYLIPAGPFWHVRVHRIHSPRPLDTIEGGFAIARSDGDPANLSEEEGAAMVETTEDIAGIRDLGSTVPRQGRGHKAPPNTNLIVAKTSVPQLRGRIGVGESLLVTAVLASADLAGGRAAWARPPAMPDVRELDAIRGATGITITAMEGRAER